MPEPSMIKGVERDACTYGFLCLILRPYTHADASESGSTEEKGEEGMLCLLVALRTLTLCKVWTWA